VLILTFLASENLRLNVGHLFASAAGRGVTSVTAGIVNRRKFSLAKFLGKLSSKFVEQEFAASKLQVLLRHRDSTLKSCIDKGRGASHDQVGVNTSGAAELLLNAGLVFGIEGLNLARLAIVKKLASHTRLHRNSERTLELATGL
jgi:hypothetical protein